jgi:hypothetical protein
MGDKAGGAFFLLWMSYWFGDLEWFEWHYCLNQRGWHDHCIGLYLDDNDGGIGGNQYYGITPYSFHFRSCIYVLWLVIEVFVFYLLKHLISLIVTFHRPMFVKPMVLQLQSSAILPFPGCVPSSYSPSNGPGPFILRRLGNQCTCLWWGP